MALIHHQPFKAIYLLLAISFEAFRFPLWILLYLFPFGRQHAGLGFLQAIGIRVIKTYLTHTSAIEMKTGLPLSGWFEGKRFTVLQPAQSKYYVGELEDSKIVPTTVGGTWYPEAYNVGTAKPNDEYVVLHIHGGAFVIGDGREFDAGYLCRTLIKHMGVKRAFSLQYRLACIPSGRFPAPVQDAVTAYTYLLHTLKIPSNRIILSGDSAGGNIGLGLLRHIAENGKQMDLPPPAAVLLWSPWTHLTPAKDVRSILASPSEHTDYLTAGFGAWGSRAYTQGLDSSQPYCSPMLHPFKTDCPIFIQGGEREVLFADIVETYKKYSELPENVVGFHAEVHAPHDIALIGDKLFFRAEFTRCVLKAKAFLQESGVL